MTDADLTVGQACPPFARNAQVWSKLVEHVAQLMGINPQDATADSEVDGVRKSVEGSSISAKVIAQYRVFINVLCDLRLQGWSFELNGKALIIRRPAANLDPVLERVRIRRMHVINRNVQLLKQSVRTFVKGMERRTLGPQGWVSIFSLMRDGRELAERLRQSSSGKSDAEESGRLNDVVRPYLQMVEDRARCTQTGFLLSDIWRYFRLTWTNEYQTVPGRNLMILVRDAAAANHPVIGIASLSSPVVHLQIRDEWIGWAPQQFVDQLRENPSAAWAKWVVKNLENLIGDVYCDDLISDRVVAKRELASPSESTIARLEEESEIGRGKHAFHPDKDVHKNPTRELTDEDCLIRAKTYLFRSKRCTALAELLRARLRLKNSGFKGESRESLVKALNSSEGRQAIETIRKHVKAIHVGNDILDISVCGAIAPYSEILGGKLVAMLLTSPEVVRFYSQRYSKVASIIASSTAGRRITRRPRLTALCTTSLYGAEPNQYTRVRVDLGEQDGRDNLPVEYRKLGLTRGQGSYHFSAVTVDAMEVLISQSANSRKVNSIFGEGVNPRLRKIRVGLDACGFPTEGVLTHGSPRVVYGIALTQDARNVLLGKESRPKYLIDQTDPEATTKAIVDLWVQRWLSKRVTREDVIQRVEKHTLVSPVEHGARVPLPRIFDEEPLFFNMES